MIRQMMFTFMNEKEYYHYTINNFIKDKIKCNY